MIEAILLPLGCDTEGDVPFETPEQVADFKASTDTHDGVQMIRHRQQDERGPAALFRQPCGSLFNHTPGVWVIKMRNTAVLKSERQEDRILRINPFGPTMRECGVAVVIHEFNAAFKVVRVEAGNPSGKA